MKKIQELVVDDVFESFVLIKQAEVRTAKNGKKFIAFKFQDASGSIDGKYWDASEEEIQKFTSGIVVLLSGKREVYQGNPQVKIINMRLTQAGEPNQVGLYVARAPMKKEELIEEINQIIFQIENAHWQRIIRHLLMTYHNEFYEFPAAKTNHHAFVGGLAFHTITMIHLGQAICKEYSNVNSSLLYSGIILHDLGKIKELTGAIATEYTLTGNLVGHLVLIDEEIVKACDVLKIDSEHEDIVLLRHMVLSHHGLLEYGSPVRPQVMEAELLHQIDLLDASVQMMSEAIKKTEPGQYTDRIFGLENRRFYVPKEK